MKRLLILFAGIIVAFPSSQKAAAGESAGELATQCEKIGKNPNLKSSRVYIPRTPGALQCFGYMRAIQNLLVLADPDGNKILGACAPEETTLLELINSFLSYAEEHPSELRGNAAVVALKAMRKTYPCQHEADN